MQIRGLRSRGHKEVNRLIWFVIICRTGFYTHSCLSEKYLDAVEANQWRNVWSKNNSSFIISSLSPTNNTAGDSGTCKSRSYRRGSRTDSIRRCCTFTVCTRKRQYLFFARDDTVYRHTRSVKPFLAAGYAAASQTMLVTLTSSVDPHLTTSLAVAASRERWGRPPLISPFSQ